jgi:ABC-2 type transport system permease protein
VRKYWRHAALAVQETIAYRVAYMLNISSRFLFYLVVFLVWGAVYGGAALVGDFSWPQMKGYLIVSMLSSALVSSSSEMRMLRAIRTGNIAVELMRPVDYQKASFAVAIGNSLTEGVLISAIAIAFALAVGGIEAPAGLAAWGAFALAMALSFATKFLVAYIFSLSAFWTNSMMGVVWLRQGITDFFSGALIPISFFPPWLKSLADWLPFRGIAYVPGTIFVGKLGAAEAARSFAVEAAWIVGLWFLAKLVWSRAMRKVTVQGG